MANSFSKEEKVAFEQLMEAFEDQLSISKKVSKYSTDGTTMERAGDTIWRPQPYIAQSFDGMDQTANFGDSVQLSVPATLGFEKSSPWKMDAKELRDALQENRLGDAARQKLASDINVAVLSTASSQGTLVVPVSTPAGTYGDVALCDSVMNEQGVPNYDRYLCLSSRDYNGMADDISKASRSFNGGKSDMAYEKGYVGEVSGFETSKMDYANRITAQSATPTIDTQVGGANFYTPEAVTTSPTTSERLNKDNRYQTITISDTTGVNAGDAFTIADVEAVHHITKNSTGELKTFRVISVDTGTTMTISPPIISTQGGSDAEAQYQNCEVVATSATAAINFLNTGASNINPFWHKDAIELIPGNYAVPSNSGVDVMRATTAQGIELVWQKFYDINDMTIKYRIDTLFGVVCKQPEMAGILIFNQP